MTLNEILSFVFMFLVIYICVYTIIDRVCICVEKCSFLKNAAEFEDEKDKKFQNFQRLGGDQELPYMKLQWFGGTQFFRAFLQGGDQELPGGDQELPKMAKKRPKSH